MNVGGRLFFTVLVRDISQRRALEREILEIAAAEQRRIGHDLHDVLGQELTALNLLAESLAERFPDTSSPESQLVDKVVAGLRRTFGHVRAVSQGLIVVEIGAGGLMNSLAELAARTQEHMGVACTFHCEEPVPVEDNVTATHLYHIAQEAVTNALKHGRARNIDIRLTADDQAVILCIENDGARAGSIAADASGMGLKIMSYRAGLIGATFTIEPAQGEGMVVTCTLGKTGNF